RKRFRPSPTFSRATRPWSISWLAGCRPSLIRKKTSSSLSGLARCSPSIGPFPCLSSSKDGFWFPRSCSIPAISTAPPGSASWASSTPNTTTDRKSFEGRTTVAQIASLFANDITRRIEEVIKVDQTEAAIIASEIDEYVVTDAIRRQFVDILEHYQQT